MMTAPGTVAPAETASETGLPIEVAPRLTCNAADAPVNVPYTAILVILIAELGVMDKDVLCCAETTCTVSPGFLIPGPNSCTKLHAEAQVPAVTKPPV